MTKDNQPESALEVACREAGYDFEFVDSTPAPNTRAALDATDRLWDITGDAAQKFAELEDALSNPDLTPEEREQAIIAAAAATDLSVEVLEEKMERADGWMRHLDYDLEYAQREAERWAGIVKQRKARADSFRAYIYRCVERLGGKYRSPRVDLAIQANPPRLIIEDASLLPSRLADPTNAKYWIAPEPAPWKPNAEAIKAALKAGELTTEHGVKLVRGSRLVDRNAPKGKK